MSESQSRDLHRALLRPAIIHTLRAAGFHSTRPAVLDTLTDLAERHLQLLAQRTAAHAHAAHNDALPTLSDARLALVDCGSLLPGQDAAVEGWSERLRAPLKAMGEVPRGGRQRVAAEKRKREEEDTRDVREFVRWFEGGVQVKEIRRVAGMEPAAAGPAAVGVGGGVVQAEDFLTALKKRGGKAGNEETRLVGSVLGGEVEGKEVLVEGGPVQRLREWRPAVEMQAVNGQHGTVGKGGDSEMV